VLFFRVVRERTDSENPKPGMRCKKNSCGVENQGCTGTLNLFKLLESQNILFKHNLPLEITYTFNLYLKFFVQFSFCQLLPALLVSALYLVVLIFNFMGFVRF